MRHWLHRNWCRVSVPNPIQNWKRSRDHGTIHTFEAVGTDGVVVRVGLISLGRVGDHFTGMTGTDILFMPSSQQVCPWLPWRHTSWRVRWAQTPQGPHIWGWALWVWGSAFWQSPRKPGQGWRAPFWKVMRSRLHFVVVVERERDRQKLRTEGKKKRTARKEKK